jgi:hypothetical protein
MFGPLKRAHKVVPKKAMVMPRFVSALISNENSMICSFEAINRMVMVQTILW